MRNLLLILILATVLPFLAFAQSSDTDDTGTDAPAAKGKWNPADPNMNFKPDGSKTDQGAFTPALPGNTDCKDCMEKHLGNTRHTEAHNADNELSPTGDADVTPTGKTGGSADKKP